MKKVIIAAFMLLAVAGTTMAQTSTPTKKDTPKTTKHHGKAEHKTKPMKKEETKKP